MKVTNILALSLISLLLGVNANAAGSLLRIACDGDDIGAEVFINDKFKGECPIDIQVSEGMQKIRVVKVIDSSYEKGFNQEIRIGDGTVKKIEVILSAAQLNAKGQVKENERIRQYQAELAEEERRNKEILLKQQKAAESGDVLAMVAMGDRYADASSNDFNKEKSTEWYTKAAKAGSDVANFKLKEFLYNKPSKDDYTDIIKILELPVTDIRNVNINGFEDSKRFIETDSFFETSRGNGKVSSSFNYETIKNNYTYSRNGKFVEIEHKATGPNVSIDGNGIAALGGLLTVEHTNSFGFFKKQKSNINKIVSVNGHPFPLVEGNRFGYTYELDSSGMYTNGKTILEMSCTVLSEKNKVSAAEDKIVACIQKFPATPNLLQFMRYRWNGDSGCFKQFSLSSLM